MHVKRKNYRHISDHQANWDNSSNNSAPPPFCERQEQTARTDINEEEMRMVENPKR